MPNVTDVQMREAEECLAQHGGNKTHAAAAMGLSVKAFSNRLKGGRGRNGPVAHIPDGHYVKGVSTLTRDEDGNPQWIKTQIERDKLAAHREAVIEAINSKVRRAAPERPAGATDADLCACYILTDYHLGQLSWAPETGEDWDMEIAENLLVRWFAAAIKAAPRAQTAILAQLGDLLHYDSLDAITPTSGHLLDADTRFQRLVRVAIRALRRVIALLLQRHERVIVLMCEGNHDLASSVWLREVFAALYEDEPRITVDTTPHPYYCHEWGSTSLFFHHGHKARLADLSAVFAGKYREVFGRTTYSYAHVGHLHHVASKEDCLMVVEQHPTLAAKDAYSTRLGHTSQRGASVITYSRDYGEVGRATIRPEMVAG